MITSNGFNDKTTLDRSGLPHGTGLKLTESLAPDRRRPAPGGRHHRSTTRSSTTSRGPRAWYSTRATRNQQFAEYACTDENPEATMK